MKLVTVATHSERYYPYLKLSAEKYGHKLVTLGWGEKWKGFVWRFELMKTYLKNIDPNEIICFIDAYDILILQDSSTIETKFKEIIKDDKTKIVYSIEVKSDSFIDNTLIISMTTCKKYSINAGTYIGYSSELLKLFETLCSRYECRADLDDQKIVQKFCLEDTNNTIIFDTNSDIFLVMVSIASRLSPNKHNMKIENETLYYKNLKPCILHAPFNTDMDDIIEGLGYDVSIFKARNENKTQYIITFIKHWIKILYLENIIAVNIVFIMLLILFIYIFNIMNIKRYINKQLTTITKIKIRRK
jgi:hypothetical protein